MSPTIKQSISSGLRNLFIRKFPKAEYQGLGEYFERAVPRTELSTIYFDGIPLDILLQYKKSELPLVVFFHGAVDQGKTVIPHFVGVSYSRLVDANFLHVADPSLIFQKTLRTGWYLGSGKLDLPAVLKVLLTGLMNKLGADRLVLFGSSGGGYPALYLSQMLSKSISIVNSPATSLTNHPKRATAVSEYLSCAFGAGSAADESRILTDSRFDLHNGFSPYRGHILYLLNVQDKANITHHAIPFFRQILEGMEFDKKQVSRVGRLNLVMDDWGPGHRYPPIQLLTRVFRLATDSNVDWECLSLDDLQNLL